MSTEKNIIFIGKMILYLNNGKRRELRIFCLSIKIMLVKTINA